MKANRFNKIKNTAALFSSMLLISVSTDGQGNFLDTNKDTISENIADIRNGIKKNTQKN